MADERDPKDKIGTSSEMRRDEGQPGPLPAPGFFDGECSGESASVSKAGKALVVAVEQAKNVGTASEPKKGEE